MKLSKIGRPVFLAPPPEQPAQALRISELSQARRLQLVLESYRHKGFAVILEALERGWISLGDWETDKEFYGRDKNKQPVGQMDVMLTPENSAVTDMVKNQLRSMSLVKGDRVLLPGPVIIPQRAHIDRLLRYAQERLDEGKPLRLSCWPGLALYNDTIPASMYDKLEADEKKEVDKPGNDIKVIFAIDNAPLSDVLMAPQMVRPEDIGRISGEAIPEWLSGLRDFIDEMVRNKKLIARDIGMFLKGKDYVIPGFEDYVSFESRDGDAVMLLSRQPAKAAYAFKKTLTLDDGTTMPWDKAITTMMKKFQGEYRRVKSTVGRGKLSRKFGEEGEERFGETLADWSREPKLRLSDWLFKSGNGIRMRRDFTANMDAIKNIVQNGVQFADAAKWAEEVHTA
jgi:hypothetical protein